MSSTEESCSVVLYSLAKGWGLPSLSVACCQVEVSVQSRIPALHHCFSLPHSIAGSLLPLCSLE